MSRDPRAVLRQWLPHLALLGLIALAGWWMLVVIAPLHASLTLAIALAVITYPVLFLPIDRLVASLLPSWDDKTRRYVTALAATTVLGALVVGACFAVLIAVVGDLSGTLRLVVGLALQDSARIAEVVDLLVDRTAALVGLFPDLPVDLAVVRREVEALLSHMAVGPAFVQYLITGTGGMLAQAALTLVTLFYLYSQGPHLVQALMSCLPLSDAQRATITARFHSTAIHLITGTAARALCHGLALGLLAWAIGGFNPVLVAIGAGFIALLPVAGPTVAWLPLASVLWTQGYEVSAVSLGISAISASWLIERLAERIAIRLGTNELWLSFLLFLGIVGGLLSFGPLGLILGPAAVLTVSILIQVLPALYGRQADLLAKGGPESRVLGPELPGPDDH